MPVRLGRQGAMARLLHIPVLMALALGVAACSEPENPRLLNLPDTSEGPDEFLIIPNRPLEIPQDVAEAQLPLPTPGGVNLAGAKPRADVARALGGDLDRARGGSGQLLAYATRFGIAPNIRADLAVEDLDRRRDNEGRLLERLFGVSAYFDAYDRFSLDKYAELERFRRAGVRTPSAPALDVPMQE